jgi:uncharacterized protein (TIGR02271 family)
MIETQHIDRIEGSTAYDAAGEKVGRVGQLYLDDESGTPSWITVATGLFGTSETFVPLEGASFDGEDLRLAYSKDTIKNAPRMDTDEHLDQTEEAELYRYYGLGDTVGQGTTETYATDTRDDTDTGVTDHATTTTGTGTRTGIAPVTTDESLTGRHLADASTGDRLGARDVTDEDSREDAGDDDAMTLSEERLRVGTETRETRARLRKYVVTENETITVPVRKEKLVVERVPAGDAATDPITEPDGSEVIEEITLREERVVVGKETVAVEQVRVGKQQVTEEQEVTEQVRRERADVDVDRPDR